jgi:uncharacterized protein with NRDE domain
MCLVLVAVNSISHYKIVLIANRDEFHDRQSVPLTLWENQSNIYAGRDLEGKGTWLGVSKTGRIATVTNVRSGKDANKNNRSRGLLVSDFLNSNLSANSYIDELSLRSKDYSGFNIIVYDGCEMAWHNNHTKQSRQNLKGIHTLSNSELNTPWPKSEKLRKQFEITMGTKPSIPIEPIFQILKDQNKAPDDKLPETNIGYELEKHLSSIFIRGDAYGTRCSSIITIDNSGNVYFHERSYGPNSRQIGYKQVSFEANSV